MAYANKSPALLFTPGPLTTSATVKQAMLVDLGSRDGRFLRIVNDVCTSLLAVAGVARPAFDTILMQGSGTFGLEAVIGSIVPAQGKLLVPCNGAYGKRLVALASRLGVPVAALDMPEDRPVDAQLVLSTLSSDNAITHVAMVHCETSTGLLNPIEAVGAAARSMQKTFICDAMSSFGAVPIDFEQCGIDFLVSSSNKCLQGVPGFSFTIANTDKLKASRGSARSVSLDLLAQWEGISSNGQFRFTPPTHSILAFAQALQEFLAEGGVEGRAARYQANRQVLMAGMTRLGFEAFLEEVYQSYIITSFRYPSHDFDMPTFYETLSSMGFAIYPGKVSDADCFRIGTIGELYPHNMKALLVAIEQLYSPETKSVKAHANGTQSAPKSGAALKSGGFPIKAVVLDWAGTMVDFGCCAPAGCFVELFRRHGVSITSEDARGPMGTNKRDHIEALCRLPHVQAALPQPDIDEMYREFIPLQTSVLADYSDLIPGAKELAAELQGIGVKLGSTTGYSAQMMKIVAPLAAQQGYIPDAIVAGDEVPQGRPAPWMALQALQQMNCWPPAACVKVGDTVTDVHEGLNAGMWVVALTTTGNELGLPEQELKALSPEELQKRCVAARERLTAAGAHYVVDTLAGVMPVLNEIAERIQKGERP